MSTVAFRFSKKIETKIQTNASLSENENQTSEKNKDYILSLENKKIRSTNSNIGKKEYIIPLLNPNQTELDILQVTAINEILQETQRLKDGKNTKLIKSNLTIALESRQQDNVDNLNIINTNVTSEIDPNYDSVPIEEYGKAVLRGMGWKSDQPIGLRNKGITKSIEPVLRPKGMGLGAEKMIKIIPDPSVPLEGGENGGKDISEDQKILGYVVGSPVVILHGSPYSDMYAKIEGLDEDNCRIIVRLAMKGGVSVSVPKYLAKCVSQKEYEKCHRYLNKGKADVMDHQSRQKMERTRSYGLIKLEDERIGSPTIKSEKVARHDSDPRENYDRGSSQLCWVRPNLVVRFIDRNYDGGKWYEKKIHVLSIKHDRTDTEIGTESTFTLRFKAAASQKSTDARNDTIKLKRVSTRMLETVIPKGEDCPVMIIKGKYGGKIGQLIHKDKRTQNVTVKFRDERDKRLKSDFPFEFVCEYRPET